MSELRKNILNEARRIVVKIGSRILVDSAKGGVRSRYIQKLADSVSRLMEAGKEVVIVTSGAVGTGMAQLGYKEKPTNIAEKQACAAVGQIDLMYAYREMFSWVDLSVGQILLSADDFRDRARYKNLQNTIKAMLARKIVPRQVAARHLLERTADFQFPLLLALPVLSARRSRHEFPLGDCGHGTALSLCQPPSRELLQENSRWLGLNND